MAIKVKKHIELDEDVKEYSKMQLILKNIYSFIVKYNKFIVLVGVLLLVIISVTAFLSRKDVHPIVYVSNDSRLYLSQKGKNEKLDLSIGSEFKSVKYASNNAYVLYVYDDNVYLYNNKNKIDNILLFEDVISYRYNNNEEYVISLNNRRVLKSYNILDNKYYDIGEEVSSIIYVGNELIVYLSNDNIYVSNLDGEDIGNVGNYNKSYVNSTKLSSDGKYLFYVNDKMDLIKYDLSNKEYEVIASNVVDFYGNDDLSKMFIELLDDSIYYYDGSIKITDFNVENVFDYDANDNIIIYTKKDGFFISKDNFQIRISDESDINRVLYSNNGVYYSILNELYYVKIKDTVIVENNMIDDNVIVNTVKAYKKGIIYVKNDDIRYLYSFIDGKKDFIDKDVYMNEPVVSGNDIYYLKNYDDNKGLFVKYNGRSVKKIKDDVNDFVYFDDNSIYYLRKEDGKYNLYLEGVFDTLIDKNVKRIK